MMSQTLVIKDVDLDLLEQQRISLGRRMLGLTLTEADEENLQGLMNMLDDWSDKRYNASLGSVENQKAKERQLTLPGVGIERN